MQLGEERGMRVGDGDGERGAEPHAVGRMRHCRQVNLYTHSDTAPLFVAFYVVSTGRETLKGKFIQKCNFSHYLPTTMQKESGVS